MSHLITCSEITKSFGPRPLFEGISLTIHEGERIGMIGPNGAGKSTFLKILAGVETSDSGTLLLRKGLRVAYLPQSEDFDPSLSVEDVLMSHTSELLSDEERHGQVGVVRNIVGLPSGDTNAQKLSGGWRKRLAIATRLLHDPDLLLLDEPTNHLDLDGILWLEQYIATVSYAVVIISHDRTFLENATTRTIEINRRYPQGFLSVDGNYSQYLVRREEMLQQLRQQEASLANTVRREVEWLRRGPKARTTKASARIQQAEQSIAELSERRSRAREVGTAAVDFSSTGRQTKQLIVCDGVSKSFGERKIVKKLSMPLVKGTKLGIVGPNGEGKSTILKLLIGALAPDEGSIYRAPALRIVTFDQQRDALERAQSLRRYLAPESDTVIFQGNPLHVASYASRFLFKNEQLEAPIASLSGGEQARLLIAKLMLQPADVLLLDEPTNDLDIDTLQVLEENLSTFEGAVVLITHDRLMIEGVCNLFLAVENGETEFYASYAQWQEDRAKALNARKRAERNAEKKPQSKDEKTEGALSAEEKRELDGIGKAIEKAEKALKRSEAEVAELSADTTPEQVTAICEKHADALAVVEKLYARWEELEARRSA